MSAPGSVRISSLALAALLWSGAALALTDEEVFRDFSLSVPEPGARAEALGGAFIGLADDATAAWVNPGGLTRLRRTEVSAVLRRSSLRSTELSYISPEFLQFNAQDRGVFQGSISLGATTEPRDTLRPVFLSVAVPLGRWAFGLSRQEVLVSNSRASNAAILTGTRFQLNNLGDVVGIPEPVDVRLLAEGSLEALLAYYNVTGAVELHPRFSLGATVSLAHLDVSASTLNLFVERTAAPGEFGSFPTLAYRTAIDDSDVGWTASAGLLWRPADSLGLGAVYRRGARMTVVETISEEGFLSGQALDTYGSAFEVSFNVPDSYGGGLSWRPLDPLTFLVDAVYVEYSDVLVGMVTGLNALTDFDTGLSFTVDDAWVYRAGVEYVLLPGGTPVALRLGAYRDPDNRLRLDVSNPKDDGLAQVFPARGEETHLTAGLGATFRDQLQLDLAVDRSDLGTTVTFSLIFRMK